MPVMYRLMYLYIYVCNCDLVENVFIKYKVYLRTDKNNLKSFIGISKFEEYEDINFYEQVYWFCITTVYGYFLSLHSLMKVQEVAPKRHVFNNLLLTRPASTY